MRRKGILGLRWGLGLAAAALLGGMLTLVGCPEEGGKLGNAVCLQCHDGVQAPAQAAFPESAHSEVACETCHGGGLSHVQSGGALLYTVRIDSDFSADGAHGVCASCHEDIAATYEKNTHFTGRGAACSDCHNVHVPGGMRGSTTPPAEFTHEDYSGVCGRCHETAAATYLDSLHTTRDIFDCSFCHDAHGESLFEATVEDNQICQRCHSATYLGLGVVGLDSEADVDIHTGGFHPVDPAGSGSSRCTKCHMPPASLGDGDENLNHAMRTIPPTASNEAPAAPNSCAGVAGCHDGETPGSGPFHDATDPADNNMLQPLYESIGEIPGRGGPAQ